jgi:uncharacterized protein YacL
MFNAGFSIGSLVAVIISYTFYLFCSIPCVFKLDTLCPVICHRCMCCLFFTMFYQKEDLNYSVINFNTAEAIGTILVLINLQNLLSVLLIKCFSFLN